MTDDIPASTERIGARQESAEFAHLHAILVNVLGVPDRPAQLEDRLATTIRTAAEAGISAQVAKLIELAFESGLTRGRQVERNEQYLRSPMETEPEPGTP